MASITWTNPSDGLWSDNVNWSGGVAPGPGDSASIDLPNPYLVTLDNDVSIENLTLGTPGPPVSNTRLDVTGTLALSGLLTLQGGATLQFEDGASFAPSGGSILLGGDGGTLDLNATTPLDAASITIAADGVSGTTTVFAIGATGTLTLAAADTVTIENTGHFALLALHGTDGVHNLGTITIADGAGSLVLQDWPWGATSDLVNDGVISVGAGDSASILGTYAGSGTIELRGGAQLGFGGTVATATIKLSGTANTIDLPGTLSQDITLSGLAAGDVLYLPGFRTSVSYYTAAVTGLSYASGRLDILNDATVIDSLAVTDDLTGASWRIGTDNIAGGTITLLTFGTFTNSSAAVPQEGDRLIIGSDDVVNTGILRIANNGYIEFAGATTDAGEIAFGLAPGELILDHPAGFTATLENFQIGDTITLAAGSGYALGFASGTLDLFQNGTLEAGFGVGSGYDLTNFTLDQSAARPAIALVAAGTGTGAASQYFLATNTSNSMSSASHGDSYSGPVAGLAGQFINVTPDNLNVATATPNVFIRTGAGDDAVQVTSGDNVIDASTGSNFVVGGSGNDTFFVDTRGGQTLWDTISNFHAGDAVTIWGFTAGTSGYTWADGLGAAGYTGLTLQIAPSGDTVLAKTTFAGLSSADLPHLAVQTGSVGGNDYLSVIYT